MSPALHSLSVYQEIVAHSSLNLMTKLTDGEVVGFNSFTTAKEQSEAFHRAWIANTEVKLLESKNQFINSSGLN